MPRRPTDHPLEQHDRSILGAARDGEIFYAADFCDVDSVCQCSAAIFPLSCIYHALKPCVYYHATLLSNEEADAAYCDLLKNTKWEKTAKINRWVSLCTAADDDDNDTGETQDYKYRDAPGDTVTGFPETVKRIQQTVQEWYAHETGKRVEFNVCLLNFYEDGQQRLGWHSDREEIGRDTPIASVSLGVPRSFLIRSKTNGVQDRASLSLQSGSLVIMENVCQHKYLHSVPKEADVTEGRINLTFRCKDTTTAGEQEHERRDNWLDSIIDGAAPVAEGWSLLQSTTSSQELVSSSTQVFGNNVPTGDLPLGKPNLWYLIKTNLGAESYCAAEVLEVLATEQETWGAVARPLQLDGFVGIVVGSSTAADEAGIVPQLLQLRTAHHVIRYHCHFDLEECCTEEFPTPEKVDGETLYQYFKRRLVEGSASISTIEGQESVTFRVTSDRIGGPHAFNRTEVERCVALCADVVWNKLID